jgi:uncharacterized membrane protein
MIVDLILYESLPPKLTFGPVWIAPVLVGGLLVPVLLFHGRISPRVHNAVTVTLIAILNFFTIASVLLLINELVNPNAPRHGSVTAADLLRFGALIWSTNVIVYALWFWQIDDGGVEIREGIVRISDSQVDFLFPQLTLLQSHAQCVPKNWQPHFLDYLYLSFTNALAFSPTDVLPLTRIAKVLMLIESLISFTTVALILARSVNILT